MTGTEIKAMVKQSGAKLWEVGERLGMNDGNFSRRLRKPFAPEEVNKVKSILAELKKERSAADER